MLTCKFKATWESFSEAAMEAFECGDMDTARALFEGALGIADAQLGRRNIEVARCIIDLADFSVHTGDLDQAAMLYAEAGTIYDGIFGRNNLISGMISRLLSEIVKIGCEPAEAHRVH